MVVKYNIMKSKIPANENVRISSNYSGDATWLIQLVAVRKCRKHFSVPLDTSPPIWPARSPSTSLAWQSMTTHFWLLLAFHFQLRTSCLNLDSTVASTAPFIVFDLQPNAASWLVRLDGCLSMWLAGLSVCLLPTIQLAINNLVSANCPLAFLLVLASTFPFTGANALGRSVTFPETTTNKNNNHYNWYFSVFCVYI